MALRNVIKELEELEAKEKVLTIYLNTDRAECQNGSWKIKLKNGLKRLEEYISLSGNEYELRKYKKSRKTVEKMMNDSVTDLQKSVIIFASNQDKLFSVHFLQVPVKTEFFWEDKPHIDQLKQLQRTYETSGVVIANEDELLLMHSELGELETINQFYFEAYTDDWRMFEGMSASERQATGANHRDHFQDRLVANQQRWMRSLLPTIEQAAALNNWQHVHIIGQANYLNLLEMELDLPIKSILRKTVPDSDQKDMIYKEIKAI
ncbi:hypothetical protein DS745_12415 [Anaerobacillus alkaliphilus]|uniref:Uncharacterized protein n=1 Tax=Anaerobacillus alkaliphilus TaxID=1548597 RepID=A0A4Q0VUX6_9BACI|nr:VLRF1 family aeRF1-type release factor [Anaerobacillus alkaliphilus]RXJ00328.1 hypothetical protein DS745_12415 [Anaerobacillus alkaliphilus]